MRTKTTLGTQEYCHGCCLENGRNSEGAPNVFFNHDPGWSLLESGY
jgi:hypothetical protein